MRKQIQRWLVLTCCVALLGLSSVALAGCDSQSGNSSAATNSNRETTETTETTTITAQASNQDMTQLPKLEGKATVVMTVNGSPITIEVDGDNAPMTAGNFVDLVQQGVYDGLVFHRVVTSPQPFVAQGGDPQGKDPSVPASRLGTGSFIDPDTNQPRYIPLEIKPQGADEPIYGKTLKQAGVTAPPVLAHTRGAVAMARSQMPNSASAQFYFALADLQFLDGDYAVFGYVTEGMEAVDAIAQGDRIDSAEVTAGLDNLKK